MLRRFFFLLLTLPLAAEEVEPAPELADGPLPAVSNAFAALVKDHPATTRIAGFYPAAPFKNADPAAPKPFAEMLATAAAATPNPAALEIDWLNQNPAPTHFSRTLDLAGGYVRSTHLLGTTHLTRTVLASGKEGVVFVHFIADKPGDISFRASLKPPGGKGEVKIEDRRELAWVSPTDPAHQIRVWVIPFESDVEPDGNAILLRGEGECLLIFAHTTAENPAKPLAGTFTRLGETHDPGHIPPDPTKIWQAVSAGVPAP